MHKSNKGFTLVELLVVIAIIGILASVVLVSLNSARSKARDARRVADLHQISLALENYYDSNQGADGTGADTGLDYPTSLSLLESGSIGAPFIAKVPTDPQTGVAYSYVGLGSSSSSCTSYHLGGTLESTGHSSLSSDADAAAGTACSGTDFAGTDPLYDIKP